MNSHYNINDDHLREVLRVRSNMINAMNQPVAEPVSVNTVVATEKPKLSEWFDHIKNALREKDKHGLIKIK